MWDQNLNLEAFGVKFGPESNKQYTPITKTILKSGEAAGCRITGTGRASEDSYSLDVKRRATQDQDHHHPRRQPGELAWPWPCINQEDWLRGQASKAFDFCGARHWPCHACLSLSLSLSLASLFSPLETSTSSAHTSGIWSAWVDP